MRTFLSWCAGPAAAHATLPLPETTEAPSAPEPAEVAHLRAARAAAARGDLAEALRHFDAALLLAPGLAVAQLGRTVCLAGLDRRDDAMRALREGLSSAQTAPGLALQLSRAAAREGNHPLAMDLLGHALAVAPDAGERVLEDPAYAEVRDHPRLLAMLGRV